MTDCLECAHASKCHEEIRGVLGLLNSGVKAFEHGQFMQADDDFKLAIIRLEAIDNRKNGRI